MTAIAELQIRAVDKGKTYYESIARQAKGTSQYRDDEYSFENLEGYWKTYANTALVIGQWYDLELATKPKTGPNAKEGSLYMDIVRMAPVDAVPDYDGYLFPDDQNATAGYQDPRAQQPSEKPNAGIAVEGVVQGHLEKLAVDLYISDGPDYRLSNGEIDYLRIREIRDAFYHQVKEKPIQHEHYCYEHETARRATKAGSYVHEIGDQWCSKDGIYDAKGQPVEDELPF